MSETTVRRGRGRPPKRQDGEETTHHALVRAGLAAMTEFGYGGVGLEQILQSVAIPKGSFYNSFPSKEAYGLAILEDYRRYFGTKLDLHLRSDRMPVLHRILDFVEDARAGMARFDFRRGCLVGNLAQEVGGLPPAYREGLTAVIADWETRLAECLTEAQTHGELEPTADPLALARYFWIGWEGAVMRARLAGSAVPLDLFATQFLDLLPKAKTGDTDVQRLADRQD